MRGRLTRRDNLFYVIVLGLIATITLVWVGIYFLYTLDPTANGGNVGLLPAATSTNLPATPTPIPPTAAPTADVAPAMPAGLTTVSVSTSGVTLEWRASVEADLRGYRVYRGESQAGPFTPLTDQLLAQTEYTDAQAPHGQDSYYQVTAVDRAGHESPPVTIRVNVPAVPPTPTSTPTIPPTVEPTPQPVVPTPTQQVIVVPGPSVEVTRIVPVPVAPTATPTTPPAPTATVEPTATSEPEAPPTPQNTPTSALPALTETPLPSPEPTTDTSTAPTEAPSPFPSPSAAPTPAPHTSSPAASEAPPVELTTTAEATPPVELTTTPEATPLTDAPATP